MTVLSFSRCPTSSPEECSFPCGDSQGGSKCLDSSQRAATDTCPVCALWFLRSVSRPRPADSFSCHHETTDPFPAKPYCSCPNSPDRLVLLITKKEQPDRRHAQRLAHTCISLPPRLINYFFFLKKKKTGFCLLGTENHKKEGLKGQFVFTAWITTLGTSEINSVKEE